LLASVYAIEWLQHQFRFYDIQALDIVQMPRPPADYLAWTNALAGRHLREWELSNARYLLALAPLVDLMNQQFDPGQNRFRLHTAFQLAQTAEGVIQVQTNATGPFGLIEFTARCRGPYSSIAGVRGRGRRNPRAPCPTNFSPHAEALVAEQIPAPAVNTSTQPAAGPLPRLSADAAPHRNRGAHPCVLLVNDLRPALEGHVDGRPEPLLRVNFLMRRVYLVPAGADVEFRFDPPLGTLWFSLSMIALSLGLCGYAIVLARRAPTPRNSRCRSSAPTPRPARTIGQATVLTAGLFLGLSAVVGVAFPASAARPGVAGHQRLGALAV
jgi:hypothetical protein